MMKKRLLNPARIAVIAVSLFSAATLAACSPDPYPTPVAEEPPPPPPAELAGGPPPAYYPPPPPEYAPSAPVVIAMAPIPNPPEKPRRARRPRGSSNNYSAAPRYIAPRPSPAPRAAAASAKPGVVAKTAPGKITPPAKVAKGAKPTVPALKAPAAPKVAGAANTAAPTADRATRLGELQTALAAAISKGAKLVTPDRFVAGQPADVRLTVPADFADTVKAEAEKTQLADAASSVNLTAALSGEGYAVSPDETQSLPLAAGQPTEFHWAVTAQPNAKGPLHADVGADLLGGGADTLNLGSVSAAKGWFGLKDNPRLLGFGIIVLLGAFIIAFLARGRSAPARSASARRAARRAVRSDRPFDLDGETA